MKAYAIVPSASQFKSDSAVLGATRAKDVNLHAIDGLLDALARATQRDERFTTLTELFFAINSWTIALRAKTPGVEPKRYDAVMALLGAVERELMTMLGVGNRGTLAHELIRVCGLPLTDGGQNTDMRFMAQMMKSARREASKLHISGGVIKRYTVDIVGAPRGLQPVDSAWFVNNSLSRGTAGSAMTDFAPFVMSMEREFYMAYHFHGQSGVYHSAYFGGRPVAMAGAMLIKQGRLLAIRGDSGHFQPGPEQMANALRALKIKGVNLKGVQVYDYLRHVPHRLAEAMANGSFSLEGHQPPVRTPTQVAGAVPSTHRSPNAGRPLPPIPGGGANGAYGSRVPAPEPSGSYGNDPSAVPTGRRANPNAGRPLPPIPTRPGGGGAPPYANAPEAVIDAEAYMAYN